MMATARSIVKADALTRAGGWPKIFGSSVYGKCIGVVGTGAIEKGVRKKASGFSCKDYAFRHQRGSEFAKSVNAEYVTLERLLDEADFVSVHVPLNAATRGMIGKMQLASMKDTAYLINTARGGIVDEEALADALDEGIIAGAGIDVYMHEPPQGSRLALSGQGGHDPAHGILYQGIRRDDGYDGG
ncbi:MAG: hypothetical protein MZU95_11795 [Desulfomicrobium escambiense]|nr:hypothetical protein [Desulfomicrobium escambiense]